MAERCRGSRGIAWDAQSHSLFAGCAEGKAVVMDGRLAPLATVKPARGAHCVTTDGNNTYVCDPDRGRIPVIPDTNR